MSWRTLGSQPIEASRRVRLPIPVSDRILAAAERMSKTIATDKKRIAELELALSACRGGFKVIQSKSCVAGYDSGNSDIEAHAKIGIAVVDAVLGRKMFGQYDVPRE